MPPSKNKIPERWESYSPMGDVIEGTRFICFKVPLQNSFNRRLPKDMWFTPDILLQYHIPSRGRSLGMVIDLTNTPRYYDPHVEFESRQIKYHKIYCPGHHVPPDNVVSKFNEVVDEYIQESDGVLDSEDKEYLIGIHCTHGVNRTGYLVCRYMVEKLGWTALGARQAFEEARGFPIERENYIVDLERLERKDTTNKDVSKKVKKLKKRRKRKHSTSEEEESEQEDDDSNNPHKMMHMMQTFMSTMQQGGMMNGQPAWPLPMPTTHTQQATPKAESISSASSNEGGRDTPVQDEQGQSFTYDQAAGPHVPTKLTATQRRNMRKSKGKKFLKIMEKGKFHEIQEALDEKFSKK